MNHPDEQELVLYLSGDAQDADAVRDHLARCESCRIQVQDLERVVAMTLESPIPEPDADFERRVWEYQRQRLRLRAVSDVPSSGSRKGRPLGWIAGIAALAASLVLAFMLGRTMPPPSPAVGGAPGAAADAAPTPAADPDRVLLAAVSEQLRRSRSVLAELANVAPGDVTTIALQQQRAHDLVATSRLIRQSARLRGRHELAGLLEEIERLLLDVARAPAAADELESWRQRIHDRDLLFKASAAERGARSRPAA